MSILIYWRDAEKNPQCEEFAQTDLAPALARTQQLRKEGFGHVCISSELDDNTGLPGVSDKLPDDYSWTKQHRGGPPLKAD